MNNKKLKLERYISKKQERERERERERIALKKELCPTLIIVYTILYYSIL